MRREWQGEVSAQENIKAMSDGLREIAEMGQGSALRSTYAFLRRKALRKVEPIRALRKTLQGHAATLDLALQRLIKIGKDKGGHIVAKFKTPGPATPPVVDKFKIGDKVAPPSGGPEMIVIGLERNIPNGSVIMVVCEGKDKKIERWHVNSLMIVPQTSAPAPTAPSLPA